MWIGNVWKHQAFSETIFPKDTVKVKSLLHGSPQTSYIYQYILVLVLGSSKQSWNLSANFAGNTSTQ